MGGGMHLLLRVSAIGVGDAAGGISLRSWHPPTYKQCFHQLPHEPDKDLRQDEGIENRPIPPGGYNMHWEDGKRGVPC